MFTAIKNITKKNIFVDVEGAEIPVKETHVTTKVARSFQTIADMETRKFRRLFDRHKVAFRY